MFRSLLFVALFATVGASILDTFQEWVHDFSIKFRDEDHFHTMFQTWRSNHEFIQQVNNQKLSYELGHNQFSGMNSSEFREYLGTVPDKRGVVRIIRDELVNIDSLPGSVDWTTAGAVTPVKDQGQCGSCWSFSTTGALEGAYFNKYGTLVSFSEQQLVDCDTLKNGGRDHGCNGGLMDNAFNWISKNNGLCAEESYPYVSGTTKTAGSCQTKCSVVSNSDIAKYVDVSPSSDNSMMAALAQQPVAIAIEADQREFQLYKSGVFTGTCGTTLDHGVLAVGYGTMAGQDYYLVKNSWGTTWGSNGYILLGRGVQYNNGDGQCGMLLEGSYPVL